MKLIANISSFEVDEEALGNLREYSLANSLYWALAEGHACEQSARRNAMDVSTLRTFFCKISDEIRIKLTNKLPFAERLQECW